MPAIIRPATGIYMAVGIPFEPITLNVFDIAMHRFTIMGSNNGTCYNSKQFPQILGPFLPRLRICAQSTVTAPALLEV